MPTYRPPAMKKSNGEPLLCPSCNTVRKTRIKDGWSCRVCKTHFDGEGILMVRKCRRGHEMTPENQLVDKINGIVCRTCKNENTRRYRDKINQCSRGHVFTPENTYIRPGTVVRQCRTCKAESRTTYKSLFPQLTLTPSGEILRCPECQSTSKAKDHWSGVFTCKKCKCKYEDDGTKIYQIERLERPKTPKVKGIPAGKIEIGRGLAGWR